MPDFQICRWIELGPERDGLISDLDRIFFSSSARQSFESEREKAEFRERWLGRFLKYFPDCTVLALDRERRAIGYVIGSLDDPATDPLFAGLPILAAFAALTARYPAQLHINIDEAWRGRGIGGGADRSLRRPRERSRCAGHPRRYVTRHAQYRLLPRQRF